MFFKNEFNFIKKDEKVLLVLFKKKKCKNFVKFLKLLFI